MIEAALCLGANLGDREGAIRQALALWTAPPDTRLRACSGIYDTPPWGDPDQPRFLNACALVETALTPQAALARCLEVEKTLGRAREKTRRWGPRAIDVDLLFHGESRLDEPGLTLPHPRMFARAFVMIPLAEIAPDRRIDGRRVAEAAAALDGAGVVRIADPWA